jgi:L-ascorbate metabolism protein UlaG (beta-lactamase superfamily)
MISRRHVLRFAGIAAPGGALAAALGWRPPRYHHGPPSDHFDGETFFNPGKPRTQGFVDLLRWQLGGGRSRWPDEAPGGRDRPPARVPGGELRVVMIGHASFLIQTRGLNMLVDPVWSERASPFSFVGPRRVNAPGVAFDDLPPIDLVLVSHNHYDHLDAPTLARLVDRHAPRVLTPLGNDAIIRAAAPGARIATLDWGDAVEVGSGVAVRLAEMHHWSARGLFDRNRALWGAFAITTPEGAIYHVGDSGYGGGDYFRLAAARFGPIRLALLPIGAYEPRWFMAYSHMNPEEAVRAFEDCGAASAVAHHWGTFQLTNEAIDAPPAALGAALAARGVPGERFRTLRPGETWTAPAPSA